jgi:hypothetical protein
MPSALEWWLQLREPVVSCEWWIQRPSPVIHSIARVVAGPIVDVSHPTLRGRVILLRAPVYRHAQERSLPYPSATNRPSMSARHNIPPRRTLCLPRRRAISPFPFVSEGDAHQSYSLIRPAIARRDREMVSLSSLSPCTLSSSSLQQFPISSRPISISIQPHIIPSTARCRLSHPASCARNRSNSPPAGPRQSGQGR